MADAQDLIGRAIARLDNAGETRALFHLQMALDVLTNAPIPTTIEEVEAAMQLMHDAAVAHPSPDG